MSTSRSKHICPQHFQALQVSKIILGISDSFNLKFLLEKEKERIDMTSEK